MSPDTPETRIGRVELGLARLQQRMDDLLERLAGQFKDLDEDVRSFAPIIREVDAVKADLRTIANTQRDIQKAVGDLRMLREQDAQESMKAQADALKDSRQWRRALIIGSFTVLAAIIAAAATIIAAGVG